MRMRLGASVTGAAAVLLLAVGLTANAGSKHSAAAGGDGCDTCGAAPAGQKIVYDTVTETQMQTVTKTVCKQVPEACCEKVWVADCPAPACGPTCDSCKPACCDPCNPCDPCANACGGKHGKIGSKLAGLGSGFGSKLGARLFGTGSSA